MVRFLCMDPMVCGLNSPSANLSLRVRRVTSMVHCPSVAKLSYHVSNGVCLGKNHLLVSALLISLYQSSLQLIYHCHTSSPLAVSTQSYPFFINHSQLCYLFLCNLLLGYYSRSSEACQDYQKLNSFTHFPSFTA